MARAKDGISSKVAAEMSKLEIVKEKLETHEKIICSIYSTEEVEPGQYVHNPEWDLTPYQVIIFTSSQYLVLFAATFTQ